MPPLSPPMIEGFSWSTTRRTRGWIGLDVGSKVLKAAQIEKTPEGYRFVERWMAMDDGVSPEVANAASAVDALGPHLAELEGVRKLFDGCDTAVGLSTRFAPLRSLQLPEASPEETRSMIYEELAGDEGFEEPSEVDAWPVAGCNPPAGQGRWMATSIPRADSDQLMKSLWRAGFTTRVLDVAAPAIARALGLSDPQVEEPIAALDIGAESTLFAIACRGVVGFTRILRGCGCRHLLQPLTESLGLSFGEACRFLQARHSINASQRLPFLAVEPLVDELVRTLQFVRQEYSSVTPEHVRLFGGGALLKGLAEAVEHAGGLPTKVWTLSDAAGSERDCLFGAAAGLSALRWVRRCI